MTQRKNGAKAYFILGVIAALAVAGYFVFGAITGNQANTDDAQIDADVVPVGAKVGGTVLHLAVHDNQTVKKGDLLVEIDPTDFQVKVDEKKADLEAAEALAEAQGKGGTAQNAAAVAAARAALARADAERQKADSDLTRDKRLKAEKAISAVELETAQNAAEKARAAAEQAAAQLKIAEEQHGVAAAKVKSAAAALAEAESQLAYTKIVAPRDGTLSRVAVQEGQILQPSQLIAQLVGSETYVVANFKETQVGRMRPGQRADIEIDAYPGRKFEGKVESLAAATGARFSLLPPDNASGNFVKVVQRVPVKIQWENVPADVTMKAGLSADVTVRFK
jgi:membrane fusion protein (multidrug efflux system)